MLARQPLVLITYLCSCLCRVRCCCQVALHCRHAKGFPFFANGKSKLPFPSFDVNLSHELPLAIDNR